MCISKIEKYGADPAYIQWKVVRGDTAVIRVQFLENDEKTYFDTSEWTYSATAYDSSGDFLDELTVIPDDGFVTIRASADMTANWGTKYKTVVAELKFDLQVTIPDDEEDTVWTPVIGTICVLGDVTPGGL